MNNRNENGRNFRRPSLWTMQSKAARKQILNQYIDKYLHTETKLDAIDGISTEKLNQQELNPSKDDHQTLQLQSTYPEQSKKSSNVILLDEFLRSLSIAYLGSNLPNSHTDWRNERYCELFSNLIDVDIDDVLSILTEIPSITKEICTRDCNAGDSFKTIFLQTPSPEMLQLSAKEYENKSFSVKVELTLKNSRSSLHETTQSELDPGKITVEKNNSENSSMKRGCIIMDNNTMKSKSSSKSRMGQVHQIGRVSTLVSDCTLKNVQRKINVVCPSSDTELNKKREKAMNVFHERSIQKPKQILEASKKIFGNETKSKKLNSNIAKGKKQPLTTSHPLLSYGDDIEINVYDNNEILKKFTCSQNLLISKMGYFAQVSSTKNLQDFKITVHSDHDIFKWILSWIKFDSSRLRSARPELNCLNVTPLLISASVFQITSLIESCLNFCMYNLNDIIPSYTAELGSLDDEIITRLAGMFSNVELTRVEDGSDKIISRLYCEMIMSLAQSKPEPIRGHFVTFPHVFRCALCNKFVLKEHSNNIFCLPEQQGIDYRGNFIVNHKIDTGWNITKYIKNLMKKYGSWEKVYWNMWAECHYLKCSRCNAYYSLKCTKQCTTHLKSPIFKSLSNNLVSPEGIYPCCGSKVYRFDVSVLQMHNGCKNISHSPSLEVDKCYSDIQKIYKSMKYLISTDHKFDKFKNSSQDFGSKLNKLTKNRAIHTNFSHLQTQSQCSIVGLLDKRLLEVEGYKRFPIKGWQDCQDSIADRPCQRVSSEESVSDSAQDKQKTRALCPQTSISRTHKVKDALARDNLDSSKDIDEGDSSASLLVAEEMKLQKYKKEQENDFQNILETGRISVRTVEKIERKLKKSLNEIKSSLRINQDNLRDYEDRLMSEMNNLLCQRTNSIRACLLDKFPDINLHTIIKYDKISNTGMETGARSTNVHSSESEISIGSSVKTYCSTISSSARIYHSRTSNVWNSFIPLAGTFVRVEAEWQDTFNAAMPLRTKPGKKQDDSAFINCPYVGAQSIPENKRDICRRMTPKPKSVRGKSCSAIRRSWKALAPKSKISEIESYLSTTELPKRQYSLVNTTNLGASKNDQQLMVPPCEGKQNMAFTCGFTSSVNNDPSSGRNISKESEYVNSIWMYDVRYKEFDYLSCIYMPIPLQKDYDVVKGVDWLKLRTLEHEWKSFLKLMKIDENFKRYFHHSLIKPYYHNDKRKKNK